MNSNKKILLFDLGGVIINLNTNLTVQAFAKLAERSEEDIVAAWTKEEVFKLYEKGDISDDEFREFLRTWLKKPSLTNQQLDEAWNAMILDLPKERLDFLLNLKEKYTILLLSNTNNIHLQKVYEEVEKSSGEKNLDPFFHACYYSHLIRLRKPEPLIYHYILDQHGVSADQVVFLDDSLVNLKGAETVGIQAVEVHNPEVIFSIEEYV